MAIHLQNTAPLADRVLLPGDPGRALRLAKALMDEPKMFNHNRGLWGYSGRARADGAPLSIQSTGMGGPSAAIVIYELISLGATRLIRVGTCGGLDPDLTLGQLLVVGEAIADDGTSRALGAQERVSGSAALTARLLAAAGTPAGAAEPTAGSTAATIVSTDLFYDVEHREAQWRAAGARAVEMETATLFALAGAKGVAAGALLLVTDLLSPDGNQRVDDAGLETGELRLGAAALAALA